MQPAHIRKGSYVREWSSAALHAVAWKMNHLREGADLSEHQEWLYDKIIGELERRHRRTRPRWKACSCMLCIPPFPD